MTNANIALDGNTDLVQAVIDQRARKNALVAELRKSEKTLKALIGDADGGTIDGQNIVSWVQGPDKVVLDLDALKAALGEDILADFETVQVGGKSFRFAPNAVDIVANAGGSSELRAA